ncbi:MAG: lysophospholipid acyltransferase family protein [Micropepsaceae bacterium]
MVALRSILFQIYFALVSVAMNVAWLPALLGPRRWSVKGVELWGRATLWGLKVICGLRYEVRGREHIPESPCIVAGKHQAMWDTVALPLVVKDPALVLKRQLLSVPFYGWYVRKTKMIALDRGAHAAALRELLRQAKDRLASGRPVAIFPEGTRKKPGAAPDYKPGVAAIYTQLGVSCVPFALNSGHFWRGWKRYPGTIVVEFLPAIPPGLKRAAFMSELETRIEAATAALAPAAPSA